MFKVSLSLILVLFSFLLYGCGGTNSTSSQEPPLVQTSSISVVKITASKERAYTNENILFTLTDTTDVNSVIWKDEEGNVLSSELQYVRSFPEEGSYKISADITTKSRNAQSDSITIYIVEPTVAENKAPIVDAGDDVVIYEGEEAVLDAQASDSDGVIVSYLWKEGNVTLGENAHLVLKNLAVGDHNITVMVTDDKGATASDYVLVHVNPPANNAPVAVSKKIVMYANESIAISLTGSDPDNQKLTYQIVNNPQNGSLSNNLPMVVYTPRYGYTGTDSFTYRVNDGIDNSNVATIEITILHKPLPSVPPSNTAPSADAGEDKVITIGDDLVLHGDADNVPSNVQYCWREDGRIISRGKDLSVADAGLMPGIHRLFFYVVDENGIVATDHMTLVIQQDPASSRSITYTYDAEGNIIEESIYDNGVLSYVYYYSYDEKGREVTKSVDYEMNGIKNYVFSTEYDDYGNILSQSRIWSTEPGEAYDSDRKYVYTYDPFGNRKSEFYYVDGQLEYKIYSQYDEECHLISQEEHIDYERDGIIDCITKKTFDENERVVQEAVDCDVNGVDDRIISYTYNANGNIVTEKIEVDEDNDGQIDYVTTYTYDENGNILIEESDYDADGIIDYRNIYTYDTDGNILSEREEEDMDDDGTVDYIYTRTYDNGQMVLEEADYNADGVIDMQNTHTYDADGNLIKTVSKFDWDNDGLWDEQDTVTFDTDGNVLSVKLEYYYYDADGNLIRTEYDDDGDGNIDRVEP